MLSPKRSFFIEPTDLTGASAPPTPMAQKFHRSFPWIWTSLVAATVLMAAALFAWLQYAYPQPYAGAPLPRAAEPAHTVYHTGDTTCAGSAGASVRAVPSNEAGALEVFRASADEALRVVSPQTYRANGLLWVGVSGRGKIGYAASSELAACSSARAAAASAPAEPTSDDIEVMAHTVATEVSGEPVASHSALLPAVAWTIVNRVRDADHRWPKSVAAVCRQHGAYSWWHGHHLHLHPAITASPGEQSPPTPTPALLDAARDVVRRCLDGRQPDVTSGAQHIMDADEAMLPAARHYIHTLSIGDLQFYRQP